MYSELIPIDIVVVDPSHYVRSKMMIEALDLLAPEVQPIIERRQWDLTTPEGVRAYGAFGVHVVPTICVDRHRCFENRIPTVDELYLALATMARTDEQRDIITRAWAKGTADYAPVRPEITHAA